VGRRPTSKELRELIFRMVAENPTWGASRIHGELKMLGFEIWERTVLSWMRKAPRIPEPAKRWATFVANRREAIAAMDFFTVPTLTFGVLYGFFVIAQGRRQILHFNVTRHPTSAWVSQQLREAFPYDSAPRWLIFDRGCNFNEDVVETIRNFGIEPKWTNFKSPWKNVWPSPPQNHPRGDLCSSSLTVVTANGRRLCVQMEFLRGTTSNERSAVLS
jgi:putative transposase